MPGGVWEMPDKKQNNVDMVSDECEQTVAFLERSCYAEEGERNKNRHFMTQITRNQDAKSRHS